MGGGRRPTACPCCASSVVDARFTGAYTWPGLNWRPSACEADVIATRPQLLWGYAIPRVSSKVATSPMDQSQLARKAAHRGMKATPPAGIEPATFRVWGGRRGRSGTDALRGAGPWPRRACASKPMCPVSLWAASLLTHWRAARSLGTGHLPGAVQLARIELATFSV